ncbi:HalX domain-containing protein [Halalkaliarchaeum sp. AArc-GB]|uniref:HalX domain-containing protein n=1 Tax=Halalkaliarchaeum sp. AArc-GB TaxID=3074078 RepID=UPI0028642A90|nr:HalX domain-containing protein [Halalkaliarchaeum sp. AArc-GB]MDR5674408.1 HalX domain-containing protein [Halalkaliarchaeum sp. AArc-GB]
MSEDAPLVLIVEDEPDLADLYAAWLSSDYRVRTAYGGQEALDELDEQIDVVLLDRRMPGVSGDEVLEEIRERGLDCRIAMVTAVEPDFDIVEMGFDDYLVKPVAKEELYETVESLLTRSSYDEGVQELYALASKKALLESEKGSAELENSQEYQQLERELEELRSELGETLDSFGDHEEFVSVFRDLEREADVDPFEE